LAYTVPIFNGAASTTAVDSSAARLSAHQADAESTIRAAQLDVYKAWASYKQAYQTAEQFRTVTSKESASTKDAAIMALLQARISLLQSIGRLTPSAL
jgi:outer membrane protein TolC